KPPSCQAQRHNKKKRCKPHNLKSSRPEDQLRPIQQSQQKRMKLTQRLKKPAEDSMRIHAEKRTVVPPNCVGPNKPLRVLKVGVVTYENCKSERQEYSRIEQGFEAFSQ